MKYFVYILLSKKTQKRYIGFTSNTEERLQRHNQDRVAATRKKGPWKIIYKEEFATKLEALRREKKLKSYKGGVLLKQLLNSGSSSDG